MRQEGKGKGRGKDEGGEERRGRVCNSWERGKRAMMGPVERGSRVEGR